MISFSDYIIESENNIVANKYKLGGKLAYIKIHKIVFDWFTKQAKVSDHSYFSKDKKFVYLYVDDAEKFEALCKKKSVAIKYKEFDKINFEDFGKSVATTKSLVHDNDWYDDYKDGKEKPSVAGSKKIDYKPYEFPDGTTEKDIYPNRGKSHYVGD